MHRRPHEEAPSQHAPRPAPARAAQTARGCAIADEIAQKMGGQVLSFPTDASYHLSAREREAIAMRTAGASFAQIAKHFGMTENGVRKLIKRASARAIGPEQPDLF